MKRGLIIGISLCLAVALIAGFIRVFKPTLGPSIRAVSADRLREDGIVLLNPFPWDQPTISQSQAETIGIKQGPGGPVLQSQLAEVILTNPSTRAPRLCWIVSLPGSLVTSHGPAGSPQRHASFYLVLVDARSGEFIEGTAGG
jgi:hypothetical protein